MIIVANRIASTCSYALICMLACILDNTQKNGPHYVSNKYVIKLQLPQKSPKFMIYT